MSPAGFPDPSHLWSKEETDAANKAGRERDREAAARIEERIVAGLDLHAMTKERDAEKARADLAVKDLAEREVEHDNTLATLEREKARAARAEEDAAELLAANRVRAEDCAKLKAERDAADRKSDELAAEAERQAKEKREWWGDANKFETQRDAERARADAATAEAAGAKALLVEFQEHIETYGGDAGMNPCASCGHQSGKGDHLDGCSALYLIQAVARALAQPGPGAALLARMRALEAALGACCEALSKAMALDADGAKAVSTAWRMAKAALGEASK